MRMLGLLLATTMFLTGCATAAPHSGSASPAISPAATQLQGTQWRFVALRGKPVAAQVNASLSFDDAGHASGSAGCNGYGASYLAGGDGALHFAQILSTRMACLQPAGAMETEREVMDALNRTAHARMQKDQLILLDVTGAELATLQAQR